MKLTVVFISDTHGKHELIDLPDGDILIHAGDLCKMGSTAEVQDFGRWLKDLPYKYIIVVPGNHDEPFQRLPNKCNEFLDNAVVASEGTIQLPNGLRIGTHSWTPEFGSWSFMLPRGSNELFEKVQMIDKCDILVSHGPAYSVLDRTTRGDLAGCEFLLQRVKELQPKYMLCGHIHEGASVGEDSIGDTVVYNGSQLNEKYQLVHKPVVFEIEVEDK